MNGSRSVPRWGKSPVTDHAGAYCFALWQLVHAALLLANRAFLPISRSFPFRSVFLLDEVELSSLMPLAMR